jgi:hypothetical protein
MRSTLRPLTLGVFLASGLALGAEAKKENFRLIEVSDLEGMQKDARAPVTILDANDTEFRQKNGVIPGAKLLSSSEQYDINKELPAAKDAPLVFYCSNRL